MTPATNGIWSPARPLSNDGLFSLGLELARRAAERHAEGLAGGIMDAHRDQDGVLQLGAPVPEAAPEDDVRDIGRLLMEGALRTTPERPRITDEHLLSHLNLVSPDLPPSLMALIAETISPDPDLRPVDGTALWVRLATAAARASVRANAPMKRAVRWMTGHDTHIGAYKSRLGQTNQDALFYQTNGNLSLLIVADGISISTAGSGNLASALFIQVATAMWEKQSITLQDATSEELDAFIVQLLTAANQTICEASLQLVGGKLGQHIPMGTTAVVVLTQGARAHIASLGDSRCYLLGDHGVALTTGDQNLRGEWLRSWQTPLPITLQGEGHALVGYLGYFNPNNEPELLSPQFRHVNLLPEECLLLCSDGLNDYAASSHAELGVLIQEAHQTRDPTRAARFLVEQANNGGGGDNITVLLAMMTSKRHPLE